MPTQNTRNFAVPSCHVLLPFIINNFANIVLSSFLKCYAAVIGQQLPTFRNNFSVPSSRVKHHWTSWSFKLGPIGFSEMSLSNCKLLLRNVPEERRFHLHYDGRWKSRIAKAVRRASYRLTTADIFLLNLRLDDLVSLDRPLRLQNFQTFGTER